MTIFFFPDSLLVQKFSGASLHGEIFNDGMVVASHDNEPTELLVAIIPHPFVTLTTCVSIVLFVVVLRRGLTCSSNRISMPCRIFENASNSPCAFVLGDSKEPSHLGLS